jgi:hypothetical protein
MGDKKLREAVKHIIGVDLPGHYDRQRLPAVLVDNGQNLDCPSVVGTIRHKIIGPDVVSMRGPQPNTGTVIEPQPTLSWLFLRDLEPLLTPHALHPLVVYVPSIPSQQGRYPSVSVTPIPGSQGDDRGPEGLLIILDL